VHLLFRVYPCCSFTSVLIQSGGLRW
jgi:hypothetical protein